jgi:tetratricopeptide (TPR) repeat protein
MTRRVHIAFIGGGVLALLVVVVAIYFMLLPNRTEVIDADASHKEITQQIAALKSESLPQDVKQQAIYFAQIGQQYELLGELATARDYYLQAQSVVEANGLAQQVVYYEDIARAYATAADYANAKIYLEKQKTHLRDFLNVHPDDLPTEQAIKTIDAKIREINKGVVY